MASYSDNFNRTDDPDDLGANWTTDRGELNISSNTAVGVSGAGDACTGRYTGGAMDSANYYSQVTINYSSDWGSVTARATSTPYFYEQRWDDIWSTHHLYKTTSGGTTSLDSWSDSGTSNPTVVKVTCDGSTITGDIDGTERNSASDSDLTAAGAPGINSSWEDRASWDDWSAADLGAGSSVSASPSVSVSASPSVSVSASPSASPSCPAGCGGCEEYIAAEFSGLSGTCQVDCVNYNTTYQLARQGSTCVWQYVSGNLTISINCEPPDWVLEINNNGSTCGKWTAPLASYPTCPPTISA